jgi:hypothetical protein
MGKYIAPVEDHLVLPAHVRLPPNEEHWRADAGGNVPAPVLVRLIIDTSAKRTTFIPGVLDHLQPPSGARAHLVTALGSALIDLVWVCLEFPEAGLLTFPEVLVARLPMPPALRQFHGLFGRDLLGRLESFEYEGRRGQYALRDTPGWLGWLRRRL